MWRKAWLQQREKKNKSFSLDLPPKLLNWKKRKKAREKEKEKSL